MKLLSPASSLWPLVQKIGAEQVEIELDSGPRDDIDIQLGEGGLDITLAEVKPRGGLLEYSGRQVVLYIPDQGRNIDKALDHGPSGKKVHVADCVTLEQMRQKNRFERYRAVANTSGSFEVFGTSHSTGEDVEGQANLRVCINCLKHLNYKGYVTEPGRAREVLNNFDLEEFFLAHSTLFRYLPKTISAKQGGYVANWASISSAFREKKQWRCESCGLDLSSHRNLLHTHHVDGNKAHNEEPNLKAFCADCHRKQPMHGYLYIKSMDMVTIQRLRHEQGVMGNNDSWAALLDLVDTSFNGLLRFYQSKRRAIPEVGYDVMNTKGEVVLQAELAWPKEKTGVVHDEEEKKQLLSAGWSAQTLSEALRAQR